jgi:hypothetical protein
MNKILQLLLAIAAACFAADAARAADLKLPDHAIAGQSFAIGTSGSGSATLYLVGPGQAIKRTVTLGQKIAIPGDQVRKAGVYTVIVDGGESPARKTFYVQPGPVAKVSFLARPSRVPVARRNVISGVAFVFDDFQNMVLNPTPVKFDLTVKDGAPVSRSVLAKYGIAFTELNSSSKEGAAQFVASAGQGNVRRVVQQVAAEPCNLRMKVRQEKDTLVAETDPVRDCSGNPVPDGTIVTFIENSPSGGRSTVDARVKRGIARAELPVQSGAVISVAAGVVLGNEIRWGGGQ